MKNKLASTNVQSYPFGCTSPLFSKESQVFFAFESRTEPEAQAWGLRLNYPVKVFRLLLLILVYACLSREGVFISHPLCNFNDWRFSFSTYIFHVGEVDS